MRHSIHLSILTSCLILLSCQSNKPESILADKPVVWGPFLGMKPTSTPTLLAANHIASPTEEYNGTFSLDGTEFYYTTDIPENAYITVTTMNDDGTWTQPQIASFSGVYSDYDPLFSPDGERLYFSSRRPGADNAGSHNWYVERQGNEWSKPSLIPLTTDQNEFYHSITREGIVYFNIWSTGDIFKAEFRDSVYHVTPLPDIINAGADKGDPFISPDEDYLIYRGYGENSLGRGDLFISFSIDGNWTEPKNLGEPINSSSHESCPYVTPDQKYFIFASSRIDPKLTTQPGDPIKKVHEKFKSHNNGELNIYYMSADFISQIKSPHLQ